MEANLFTLPSFRPPPPYTSSTTLSLKYHFNNLFLTTKTQRPKFPSKTQNLPKIQAAITRTKKEETVEKVKQELENCHLLAGISYKGFTVKQFQELRTQLPENTKLLVAKNTLVYKAIEGTKWEALKPCMQGMNAWFFVHSEEIPAALKPYRTFQKEQKLDDNEFTGAVFEGKFYGPDEFKALENLPTRAEIYAKLLGGLKGPASAVVGTIQAPARDLVMLLKAYCKKLEEESGAGQ
ncbi:50S ribosomal protein L10, chloroplastic [Olea europaea var. sylvestris]|uniref:Large ribosomal subunit protein uL10c n=1 Tax=Olea europaea subsp. europaea TaxID=158383 RepID=A0A8S0V8R7_OLEEU|nr:50S ribosomal protein L10, chloroplastic [Olea europaea var. sylvestris]XP_022877796.1 50S ribosomal protein L10, chloroplastic [Olea europaea var. sylvestris]CAA3026552.1 50S ribosomal L10, chloroplastic [Olea europaea subsp. europaea]